MMPSSTSTPKFLWATALAVWMSVAQGDDIDKAFSAQDKPATSARSVDASVGQAQDVSQRGVATRALEREEARRKEMAAFAATGTTVEAAPRDAGNVPAIGNFRCEFMCSTANLVEANSRSSMMQLTVSARNAEHAKDLARPLAKSQCWDRHKMLPYQRWGDGFVSCKSR